MINSVLRCGADGNWRKNKKKCKIRREKQRRITATDKETTNQPKICQNVKKFATKWMRLRKIDKFEFRRNWVRWWYVIGYTFPSINFYYFWQNKKREEITYIFVYSRRIWNSHFSGAIPWAASHFRRPSRTGRVWINVSVWLTTYVIDLLWPFHTKKTKWIKRQPNSWFEN